MNSIFEPTGTIASPPFAGEGTAVADTARVGASAWVEGSVAVAVGAAGVSATGFGSDAVTLNLSSAGLAQPERTRARASAPRAKERVIGLLPLGGRTTTVP